MKTNSSFLPNGAQTSLLWSIANSISPYPAMPDHLSIDPRSPYIRKNVLQFEIGIRFNGVSKNIDDEFCVPENQRRLPAGGRPEDRCGNPMT